MYLLTTLLGNEKNKIQNLNPIFFFFFWFYSTDRIFIFLILLWYIFWCFGLFLILIMKSGFGRNECEGGYSFFFFFLVHYFILYPSVINIWGFFWGMKNEGLWMKKFIIQKNHNATNYFNEFIHVGDEINNFMNIYFDSFADNFLFFMNYLILFMNYCLKFFFYFDTLKERMINLLFIHTV